MKTETSSISASFLGRTSFFIREHAGLLKLSDTYDILDPESKVKIGEAREEISSTIKFLRLLVNKSLLPTTVNIYALDRGSPTLLITLKRGAFSLVPKVLIQTADGERIGYFKSKMFSFGTYFSIIDASENVLGFVKGDWKGWNFKMISNDTEVGLVTKKWSGLGKELFTSADNYIISLNGDPSDALTRILLAAGLAIDIVFKEKK